MSKPTKPVNPSAHATIGTALGDLLLAASDLGLCGAWFLRGQRGSPTPAGWGPPAPAHPALAEAARQFGEYFGGARRAFELPLDLSAGTPFQQDVWRALLTIAPGQACSYSDVAARIGRAQAVRAVGTAVGANPLIVLVPCHRVLGKGGALTGFGAGLPRKAALLRREGWRIDVPHDGDGAASNAEGSGDTVRQGDAAVQAALGPFEPLHVDVAPPIARRLTARARHDR